MPPSFITELLKKFRGMGQPQDQAQSQSQPQNQMPANSSDSPLMLNQPLEQNAQSLGQPPLPAPELVQHSGLLNFLRNMRNQKVADIEAATRG